MSSLPVQEASAGSLSDMTQPEGRDIAIDYLRSFAIVHVVFFHAALAYTSFRAAAVMDASRCPFLDPFAAFCDTFFMPLLFLVSGLFTIPGLERKGSGGFFVARLKRLGIPFIVASLLISPLAHWPSHLLVVPESQTPYLATFFARWPNAPLWFLWVLLVFDGIVALANWLAPSVLAKLRRRPTGLVVLLVTIVSCLPFCWIVPGLYWVSLGPFGLEPARIGLYFAYFLMGTALGAGQQWRNTVWPKHWGFWLALGFVSFGVYGLLMRDAIQSVTLPSSVAARPSISQVVLSVTFAVCCAGTCLGFLGAFRRLVRRRRPIFDSLSANAYGVYLLHYLFVIWIQFALLSASWPAWIKFGVASTGGLALSWGTSMLVRRIPAVRRIL